MPSSQIPNLTDLDIALIRDAPISLRTYFGIGGNAEILAIPHSMQALSALIKRCNETNTPIHILGKGANLLVCDSGIHGIVISLEQEFFKTLTSSQQSNGIEVKIMGGADLSKSLMHTSRNGLRGLEAMAGIPASLGGAIRMNAGGKYGEISDNLKSFSCLTNSGEEKTYFKDEFRFSYRESNIKEPIITSATFLLQEDNPNSVREKIKDIFEWKKTRQPLSNSSAGCVFKNPMTDTGERVSAGWLIDKVGLKGSMIGGASVSNQHANFITTTKTANTSDVLSLIKRIEHQVYDNTGIHLEREVVVWGSNK